MDRLLRQLLLPLQPYHPFHQYVENGGISFPSMIWNFGRLRFINIDWQEFKASRIHFLHDVSYPSSHPALYWSARNDPSCIVIVYNNCSFVLTLTHDFIRKCISTDSKISAIICQRIINSYSKRFGMPS